MSAIDGEYFDITPGFSFSRIAALNGNYYYPTTGPGVVNNVYKNQGWYAAGGVYETWLSSPLASTVPPLGHTLTEVQYSLLEV